MIGSLLLIPAAGRAIAAAVVAGVLDAIADHQRREPTVGELGLCGHTDDDQLGPDAARWAPEVTHGAQ